MPPVPERLDWFEPEIYQRSRAEIGTLKSKLPEESVSRLAREVLARVAEQASKARKERQAPSRANVEKLCHALISDDDDAGAEFIRNVRDEGATLESVYLDYLAAAARILGEWWDEDRVPFTLVTLGTSRMYAIMRAMRHLIRPANQGALKAATFASVPGEDHTLGVRMAADLFRREGWDVNLVVAKSHDELVGAIASGRHPIIGLSSANGESAVELARLMVAIRIVSPGALILVSGRCVIDNYDMVVATGADRVARDMDEARAAMADLLRVTRERLA